MSHRFFRFLSLCALLSLPAGPGRAAVVQLFEQPAAGGRTAYQLVNPLGAATAFDITAFAVSLPSDPIYPGDPITPIDPVAPAGWSAQVLTLADWAQPMGGPVFGGPVDLPSRPTWAQFTGRSFGSAFADTATVLGFFVGFQPDAAGHWHYVPIDPIRPGTALAGFSRAGAPASDFLAAGPLDAGTFTGDVADATTLGVAAFNAPATPTPEPASATLLGLGALLLTTRRRRAWQWPGSVTPSRHVHDYRSLGR